MQITVHDTGSSGFDALLYRPPGRELIDYISHNVSSVLTATNKFGERFVNNVKSLFDRFGSERSVNESKLLLQQMSNSFRDDVIHRVAYEDLGNANLMMQHYIMANPMLGELSRKGMCHGYADTYINFEKDTYGENTMLYQNVMDGVHDVENDTLKFYHHTEMPEDGFSAMDKISVLDTWDNVVKSIFDGIDPTDPDGGVL